MSEKKISIGIIGAGRIGRIHAKNIATGMSSVRLAAIADLNLAAAREVADRLNVPLATGDYRQLLANPAIDAVAICSASDTHAQIIEEAAASGKHIFCEKPIGLDFESVKKALAAVERAGVKLQVGFNRRFDPGFARARELVAAGKIGAPHLVRITSRDPGPPPLEYVRAAGGLFMDMTIHDFDMTRFLAGSDAVEIYAVADALVDPELAKLGEVDTCVITLRLKNGALATIDNSRKAVYGYDQRVEVFGSGGMVAVGNRTPEDHVHLDAGGVHSAKPLHFFLERYEQAYVAEVEAFIQCLQNNTAPPVTGHDALMAMAMGWAAGKSLKEHRPVRLDELRF